MRDRSGKNSLRGFRIHLTPFSLQLNARSIVNLYLTTIWTCIAIAQAAEFNVRINTLLLEALLQCNKCLLDSWHFKTVSARFDSKPINGEQIVEYLQQDQIDWTE